MEDSDFERLAFGVDFRHGELAGFIRCFLGLLSGAARKDGAKTEDGKYTVVTNGSHGGQCRHPPGRCQQRERIVQPNFQTRS